MEGVTTELLPPEKEQEEQQEPTADSSVKRTASGRIVKEPGKFK